MKGKYMAIVLALMMTVIGVSGCGTSTTTNTGTEEIYGEVTKVEENQLTVQIGTKKEEQSMGEMSEKKEEQKDTNSSEETSEAADSENKEENNGQDQQKPQERPSMLELSDETRTITITDDTVWKRQAMGGGNQPDGEEPPQKPEDGQSQTNESEESSEEANSDAQKPEERKEGSQEPPENADLAEEEISLSDISEGDTLQITLDSEGNASEITVLSSGMGMGGGPGGGQAEAPEEYTAVTEYTSEAEEEGKTVSSEGKDENAIHISEGAEVSLNNMTVSRNSSDSTGGDSSSFYGIGAAILSTGGTSYIKDSEIDTDAAGGAGIFSYGDGISYVADTKITTKQDTSGGIHVAGGGTLYAWDMDVTTEGESSAAIRSDRGSGKMVVDGGSYTSNGTGSPAVYSTADIAINEAEMEATQSEAVCIEGLNSLHIYNSDLTGNMPENEQNDCSWNVILYQSMSGDSEVGNSTFQMSGGSLTAKNGGMFYTTNTESTFILSDVDINYAKQNDFFLRCTGNNNQRGWGTQGSNGADCHFTAISQEMQGDIIWDSISQLDFYMTSQSTLKGAVTDDETYAGDGGDGYCNLYIEEGSTWMVTGDSVLSSLSCEGTIQDEEGKTVTIQGTDNTVYVEGDSEYTITVDSYENTVDVSEASKLSTWNEYEMEKPSQLK